MSGAASRGAGVAFRPARCPLLPFAGPCPAGRTCSSLAVFGPARTAGGPVRLYAWGGLPWLLSLGACLSGSQKSIQLGPGSALCAPLPWGVPARCQAPEATRGRSREGSRRPARPPAPTSGVVVGWSRGPCGTPSAPRRYSRQLGQLTASEQHDDGQDEPVPVTENIGKHHEPPWRTDLITAYPTDRAGQLAGRPRRPTFARRAARAGPGPGAWNRDRRARVRGQRQRGPGPRASSPPWPRRAGHACSTSTATTHHHRSVLTLAGDDGVVQAAVRELARRAVALLDLRRARRRPSPLRGARRRALGGSRRMAGARPRRPGALRATGPSGHATVLLSGRRPSWGSRYSSTAPNARCPRSAGRRWRGSRPRCRPAGTPHPTAGAVAVGCRPLIVAYNLWLAVGDLARAKAVAASHPCARTSGPSAFALGDGVQVSCNLVNPLAVGPAAVRDQVSRLAEVEHAELVGLVPESVLRSVPEERWAELDLAPERYGRAPAEGEYRLTTRHASGSQFRAEACLAGGSPAGPCRPASPLRRPG